MKKFLSRHIITHPFVIGSMLFVGLVAVGSIAYYMIGSQTPAGTISQSEATSTSIIANGIVEPSENPDLAFESTGRVTRVNVAVGATVTRGQVLASIDSATLSAQREQAEAALRTQQANLSQMQAGARAVDVTAKQTAVDQAQLALTNLYANIPQLLQAGYGTALAAVSVDTDSLFSNPNSSNPTVNFSSSNSQVIIDAPAQRLKVNAALAALQSEASSMTSSPAAIEAELPIAVAHLQMVRDYGTALLLALSQAAPSTQFPQSSVAAAIVSVNALENTINGLISSGQSTVQQIATTKLALQSAKDSLNQTLAGPTPEQIAAQQAQVDSAQANVAAINAQIAKTIIYAPFAGVVSSVRVKVGDIAASDVAAISLTPQSALQVDAYFSEIDVVHIAVGSSADITLDAYGSSRIFPATVVSVDHSPTQQSGTPAYKVTMQFTSNDPAISPGMSANATIKQ